MTNTDQKSGPAAPGNPMAAAVVEFQARHGRLPGRDEPQLRSWLERQRRAARANRLDAGVRDLLDDAAPGWQRTRDERWNANLSALAAAPTPGLRAWLGSQRRAAAAGTLKEHRRAALDAALGGGWSAPAPAAPGWDTRAEDIIDFVDLHGRFPRSTGLDDEAPLARWLSAQRAAARAGKMAPRRMTRLDKAVPGWLPEDEGRDFIWQAKARGLAAFVVRSLRWPSPSSPDESDLAAWARTQRTAHRAGRLSQARSLQLGAIHGWPDAVLATGGSK